MTTIDDSNTTPPGYWFGEINVRLRERMRDELHSLDLGRKGWRILHTLADGPATADQLASALPHHGRPGDRRRRAGGDHDEHRGDHREWMRREWMRREQLRREWLQQAQHDHHEPADLGHDTYGHEHDHGNEHRGHEHDPHHPHGGEHHDGHGPEQAFERGFERGFVNGFDRGAPFGRGGRFGYGPYGRAPFGGFAQAGPFAPFGPFGARPGRPDFRRAGIERVLGEFVERGWVWFDGDRATLTDEGRAAHDAASERIRTVRASLADGIDPADFATTMATLEAMARNLGWTPAEENADQTNASGDNADGTDTGTDAD